MEDSKDCFKAHMWGPPDTGFPRVSRVALNKFHLSGKGTKRVCYPEHWIIDFTYATASEYMVPPAIARWRQRAPMEFHVYSPGTVFFERSLVERSTFSLSILISDGAPLGLDRLCGGKGFAIGHDKTGRLGEILSKIAELGHARGDKGFWAAQSLLFAAIDHLAEFEADKSGTLRLKTQGAPSFPEQVQLYLKKNIAAKLTLADIAGNFNMSESSLTHKYAAMTGESVMRRHMALRLNHAVELLRAGEKLDSVAEKTGFCSAFNFSRLFKRRFGTPPSKYRGQLL